MLLWKHQSLISNNFFTLSSRLHILFLDSLTIKPLRSREISCSNVPLDVNLSLRWPSCQNKSQAVVKISYATLVFKRVALTSLWRSPLTKKTEKTYSIPQSYSDQILVFPSLYRSKVAMITKKENIWYLCHHKLKTYPESFFKLK